MKPNHQVPAKIGPDVQSAVGHLPRAGTLDHEQRKQLALEEGFDPLAVELALEPSKRSVAQRLGLLVLAVVAAALVVFFFPAERFFKRAVKELGPMTIGAPISDTDLNRPDLKDNPWLQTLSEMDRLYFQEGKLSEALQLAERRLSQLPPQQWETWEKVHYRYWELLSAAGRVDALKQAAGSFLKHLPEDSFANYYYAQAFLTDASRMPSVDRETRKNLRREAEDIVARLEWACNALQAQRQLKKDSGQLTELYQKLRLEQGRLFVLIWKLGGYQEDDNPDVVYRDRALDICDSPGLADLKEAQRLKLTVYTHILDRWYWFEGPQVIQGVRQRRQTLEVELQNLRNSLKEAQAP
jgi:hypothetical protein